MAEGEPDEPTWRDRARQRLGPLADAARARFTVDTRALAALRIALGLILLGDLVHRAQDLGLFYTDAGVYPRSAYLASYEAWNLSLHALSGALWWQAALFLVAGACALALAAGYRTGLTATLSLVLLCSLQARNPAVLNGADRLLRVLLLVALFTPLGERWSVDALRHGEARSRVTSLATAALLCQPLAVFTTNAIRKHGGDTWFAGDALEIAMSNDVMTIGLGDALAAAPPELLTLLNYGWVVLVSGSLLLLLVPTGRLRTASALAYVGAFAGMLVTLMVGLFPFALAASVLPFLGPGLWDAVESRLPTERVRTALADRLDPGDPGPGLAEGIVEGLEAAGRRDLAQATRRTAAVAGTVAGAVVLVWVVGYAAVDVTDTELPGGLGNTHLNQQHWDLYAPNPTTSYSWYVAEAELADGSTADALDGGPVNVSHPDDAADTYETFRHRKFLEAVRSDATGDPGVIATSYADWACRQAEDRFETGVDRVVVHRVRQPSPVDGERGEPSRFVVIDRACGASSSALAADVSPLAG
jgi:hypothetical protein